MYNTIRKDVVIDALRWLKANNEHYYDTEMNAIWDEHWRNDDDLGILIDANPNIEDCHFDNVDTSDCVEQISESKTDTEHLN